MPSLICKYTVFLCLCFLSFVRKLTGKFSAPKKLILLLYKSTTNVGSRKTFNTWQPSIRLCLLLLSSLYLVVYLYPLPFQGLCMWPWYAVLQKISFVLLFTHHTYTLVMILEWLFRIVITRPTHMLFFLMSRPIIKKICLTWNLVLIEPNDLTQLDSWLYAQSQESNLKQGQLFVKFHKQITLFVTGLDIQKNQPDELAQGARSFTVFLHDFV